MLKRGVHARTAAIVADGQRHRYGVRDAGQMRRAACYIERKLSARQRQDWALERYERGVELHADDGAGDLELAQTVRFEGAGWDGRIESSARCAGEGEFHRVRPRYQPVAASPQDETGLEREGVTVEAERA